MDRAEKQIPFIRKRFIISKKTRHTMVIKLSLILLKSTERWDYLV